MTPILAYDPYFSIIISQYIIYNPLYTMGSSKSPQTRILKMKIPIRSSYGHLIPSISGHYVLAVTGIGFFLSHIFKYD